MRKISIVFSLILCSATLAFSQSWLNGVWEGKAFQTNSDQTWEMRLSARRGKFLIEYPSLNCSGEWKLIKVGRNTAQFRETIKDNTEDCEPTGNVYIRKLNNNQLMYSYSYIGKRERVASAILNRVK
jgi:hypothetical protein